MSAAGIPRDEVASALEVRRELGREYEAEVVGSPISGVAMRGGGLPGDVATIGAGGGIVAINVPHAWRCH